MRMSNTFKMIAAALLIALLAGADARAQGDAKAEIEKLRAEIGKLREEIKSLKDSLREDKEPGPTFRGKSVKFWLDRVHDADPEFSNQAVKAIGALAVKDKKLIPVLIELLRDDSASWSAAAALESLGPRTLPGLTDVAKDRTPANQQARRHAVRLIANWAQDNKSLLSIFIAILRDPRDQKDTELFSHATRGLADMRSKAEDAIPALIEALDKAWPDIAKEAPFPNQHTERGRSLVRALRQIEPMIDAILPMRKQDSPMGVSPGAFERSDGPGGFGDGSLLSFQAAPQQWRQAIDALKKKYAMPK